MGARNPSGFMGSISDQHLMLIQKKQVQGAKHFQWTLHSHIDVLAQGRSISIELATGTLQSCNKPTIWYSCGKTVIGFGSSYL